MKRNVRGQIAEAPPPLAPFTSSAGRVSYRFFTGRGKQGLEGLPTSALAPSSVSPTPGQGPGSYQLPYGTTQVQVQIRAHREILCAPLWEISDKVFGNRGETGRRARLSTLGSVSRQRTHSKFIRRGDCLISASKSMLVAVLWEWSLCKGLTDKKRDEF